MYDSIRICEYNNQAFVKKEHVVKFNGCWNYPTLLVLKKPQLLLFGLEAIAMLQFIIPKNKCNVWGFIYVTRADIS